VLVLVSDDGRRLNEIGNVQKIYSSFGRDQDRSFNGRHKATSQALKHVVGLSDADRRKWIEKKRPDTDVPAWWRHHCRMISGIASNWDVLPNRAEWIPFALWAWTQGREMAVLPAAYTASHAAEFLSDINDRYPDLFQELADQLPTANSIVQTCLDQLPDKSVKQLTRTDKTLIDRAMLHRHALTDEAVLANLNAWYQIRTASLGV
jgi:hypothetical protein